MLEAFDAVNLVDKLPLKICTLATWGDRFMLSTISTKNEAVLLVYRVVPGSDFAKPYEARLEHTLKRFTSKQVTQLAVIPEHKIFLALANDGELHTANLQRFDLTQALPRTRGVVCFAVDWQTLRGYQAKLRMCVAFKKKLVVYSYENDIFKHVDEYTVPEGPRSMSWIGNGLILCIKKELYHLVVSDDPKVNGDIKELFPIGQNRSEPCLLPIIRDDKHEILVLKDEKQISLDNSVKPTQSTPLTWSDMPVCIEHVHPYVIGVLPKTIEVRALEQRILVQNIKVSESPKDQVKFIAHDEMILVASQNLVYKLEPRAYEIQVQQLVLQKQFDLALEIADLIKEDEKERRNRRDEIMRRYAFYLFTQHKFDQSLNYYLEIKEDPVNVIGLYPHLLPSDIRQTITQPLPTSPPTLTGDDLKKATHSLINYLTQMRYTEQQKMQHSQQTGYLMSPEEMKKSNARLQLLDTTLLKCYVKTNNNVLIGSLVRLPDNHLHLAESERILRNEEKYQELVQLFSAKNQHSKALDLLFQFRKGPTTLLSGVWPTIDYLQNLSVDDMSLILKYSDWVLRDSPEEGIKIFTEEVGDIRNLPRREVLQHIGSCAPTLTVSYLEHIIFKWSDETAYFHNSLILLYKKEIERRLPKYIENTKGRPHAKAGEEPGELGLLRSKLLNFLHSSLCYEPESLISSFPLNSLFEERALLLGRLKRHGVALAIYAHVLKDPQMAEDYCRKIYNPEKEDNKEVYLSLVQMYLHPPTLSDLGITVPDKVKAERDDEKAMKILHQYHSKIDTAKVLSMLPEDTHVQTIKDFLTTVLEERTVHQRKMHVLRSLFLAEHLQVERTRIKEQAPQFLIDEETICFICKKRLLNSAFARYPSGDISHLYCYQKDMAEKEQDNEEYQEDYY